MPLALLMPPDASPWAIAEAFFWTLPAWLMLLAPLPALWVCLRTGARLAPGLVAAVGLLVALGPRPPSGRASQGQARYALASANTLAWAEGSQDITDYLGELGADAVVTIERRGDEIPGMVRVADNFSEDFKVSQQTALFCREGLDCAGHVSERYGHRSCRFPIGTLRVDGALCLVAIHAPPPIDGCVQGRDEYLAAAAAHLAEGRVLDDWGACRAGDPAVLMGDFNAVPGSRLYRGFRAMGFTDPFPWQGPLAASWPAGGNKPPLPFFRLDHGLPGAVSVLETRVLTLPRSDHRGAWLTVSPGGRP